MGLNCYMALPRTPQKSHKIINSAKITPKIAENAGFGEHPDEELWFGSDFESRNGRFKSVGVWECGRENEGNCEKVRE